MIYNYVITTELGEYEKDNQIYSKVLKDVSITPSEALRLYLRHHKQLKGNTIIKKRKNSFWQVIKPSELKSEIGKKIEGKREPYKINV